MFLLLVPERPSVHLRHHHVQQDGVRPCSPEKLVDGNPAVLGHGDVEALVSQGIGHAASHVDVVIDDQDGKGAAHGVLPLPEAAAGVAVSSGRTTVNVEPAPGSLCATIEPPWASANCLAMNNPRPRPPKWRADTARSKRPKTLFSASASMPMPWSITEIRTVAPLT